MTRRHFEQKVAALETKVAELEQRTSLERRFDDLEARFAARQLTINEHKRGPTGRQGQRGARGERDETGPRGPAGRPAAEVPTITAYKIDKQRYRLTPLLSNGQYGAPIELYSLFETFLKELAVAAPWRTE